MSFLKQEPPQPTEVLRKVEPMRVSVPTTRVTSSILAPVASHTADKAFT
jgi:hypothetical protein